MNRPLRHVWNFQGITYKYAHYVVTIFAVCMLFVIHIINRSWWSNWLIPALAAVIVTLMYRVYTTEEA